MHSGSSDRNAPNAGRLGPGRVVLIVGPSGSGKDTLLRLLERSRERPPGLVFARRVVTRAAGNDENNIAMSDTEFDQVAAQGGFALTWGAHGLRYGVPAAIDADITAGATVLVNASRGVIDAAKARYGRVDTVLIDAPLDVLARRLADRGREDVADIRRRLDRNPAGFRRENADLVIVNDGSPEAGMSALARFLDT